jgi:hypothetical protein
MQAIHHPYTTNQSTKNTAQPSNRNASKAPAVRVRVRDAHTRKEGRVVGRTGELRRRGRGGYQRMCQKRKLNRPPRKGRTNRRLKDGRRYVGYLRATRTRPQNASESPASESPEKQQKGLCQYTAWKGLRLSNFSLLRRVFQSPKKGHSMLYLYSSST